ncbi:Isonitrile hydratase-like protein xanA [Penicillium pulvis]|uniref:Isonitrile hydratase-like protein xanA n=1 Tax=Penicillium pulvis TaxID=1562058 RepID=UPI002546C890|nr:Isonitrile hydratase-like protein xanA [Penicillium pulvis]KAJ5810682.1 Isonitrile hydratase-like protein xanA [Penicillium pulvis]
MQVTSHVTHNHKEDDPEPTSKSRLMYKIDSFTLPLPSKLNLTTCYQMRWIRPQNTISSYIVATIQQMVKGLESPEENLTRPYTTSEPSRFRILFSVCTGALLLTAAGILSGLTVTTHHLTLEA